MIKRGKRTKAWENDRIRLKKEFKRRRIFYCELKFDVCWNGQALSFAHRHKRHWYFAHPELLSDFTHVILACIPCHNIIEKDAKLTEEKFMELRGPQKNPSF